MNIIFTVKALLNSKATTCRLFPFLWSMEQLTNRDDTEERDPTSERMPVNVGESSYGSMAAAASPLLSGSRGLETAPLLMPEPEAGPVQRWQPMTKEELEVAAGGPGWRKARSRLVFLFWLAWLAMLGTAIAIIVKSPRPIATPLKWWQKSLFYQLQPNLFVDPQPEGPGAVTVVCEHLSYLKSLGIGALILEGVFDKEASPSNLTVINESLGSVPQIQRLLKESNKEGLKVVLDLCELDLFGPQDPAGNDTAGPSELSATVQYALRFWLEQGVAGFAICDTDAAYSEKTLLEWRVVFKEFSTQEEERIVVVKQTRDFLPAIDTSGSVSVELVEIVMRSILPPTHHLLSTQEVASAIEMHLQTMKAADMWPSWTVGGKPSHDLKKLLLVLMMTLPGSPAIQFGEEISHTQNMSLNKGWSHEEVQNDETSSSHVDEERIRHIALALFTSLSHSRAREEALLYGSFTFLSFNTTSLLSSNATLASPSSPPILAFLRSWGCVHFLVLLNTGHEPHALDPAWAPSLPSAGVFVTSTGMDRLGATSLDTLTLRPHEAIVIKLFEAGSYS
ncbi:4F2 cell-surface antigen heavy chain [Myripristis murdjan]|uniref:Si:dkey-202g17.3 n=1 Tax=Myripristis murdjan TaxID=586833 RepID=A0A667YH71_9TELE|nr:4F2 cell-surface antigen heavy chain-like [Myripristis murdjan]